MYWIELSIINSPKSSKLNMILHTPKGLGLMLYKDVLPDATGKWNYFN